MSRRVFNAFVLTICSFLILAIAQFTLGNGFMAGTHIEQNDLRTLLAQLVDENRSFTIGFIRPVWGGDGDSWTFPDASPSLNEPGFTDTSRVSTVSDDHFCAEQVGYGVTDYVCVPYSNIAYIVYN